MRKSREIRRTGVRGEGLSFSVVKGVGSKQEGR